MRKLTFKGYIKQYIKELSACGSFCLKKIDKEADRNFRVVALSMLLAQLTNAKVEAVQSQRLKNAFDELKDVKDVEAALKENQLSEEYEKVYKSFFLL